MKRIILVLIAASLISWNYGSTEDEVNPSPPAKEVLLIGTFHFHNPGADVAKTKSIDVMSEKSQKELEQFSSKITQYNPTKIFVEWTYSDQDALDSLYQLYLDDKYFTDDLSDFYLKNEIAQLAFRVAKESNLDRVYGVDYNETQFPYGKVMAAMEASNQTELKSTFEKGIENFTMEFNKKIEEGASLKELMYHVNSREMRKMSNHFHNNLMLLAGDVDDFNGPFLSSEWYKRNLYMWSMIQKYTEKTDERIMVLAGSSHAAMFELFISSNESWKVKEFKSVMGD